MEEDAGSNTHIGADGRISGRGPLARDYKRAGVPLVEIVTRPIEPVSVRPRWPPPTCRPCATFSAPRRVRRLA